MAMEVFDDVLNSLNTNVSGGSGSGAGTSKSKKKRKDRDSFKNGGTWPRARGGPVIEQSTGTILHPHKHKERKPLSELLTNMPKYPIQPSDDPDGNTESYKKHDVAPVIYREDSRRHSRNKYRDHRATTYDLGKSDCNGCT